MTPNPDMEMTIDYIELGLTKFTEDDVRVLVLPWSKEAKEAMAHQMAVAIGKTPCGVCPAPVPLGYFEE